VSEFSRRHHTIPKFLLRWFALDSASDNARVWCLDKTTGRHFSSSVRKLTVIGDFNRLQTVPNDIPADAAERDLARIESECKPALAKAIDRVDLASEDLALIVLFSTFQERRTPRSRQWRTELMEHGQRIAKEMELSTPEFRDYFRKELGQKFSEAEIGAMHDELLGQFREGHVVAQATPDQEVLSMFMATPEIAIELASRLSLGILHATEGEFVLADHPVCIYDPQAPADRGAGWISSPSSQVTFPISRTTCLLFRPGRPRSAHFDVGHDVVADINLHSYANAEWAIYGSGQRWLQDTRTLARRQKSKVSMYEPKKPRLIIYQGIEGEDVPLAVEVFEPKEKVVRGFRPKERPIHPPVPKQPMSERLMKEWSRLVLDDAEN
jgi:uncharacterized protein DUF4238